MRPPRTTARTVSSGTAVTRLAIESVSVRGPAAPIRESGKGGKGGGQISPPCRRSRWGGGPHEVRWRGLQRRSPLHHAPHGPPPHALSRTGRTRRSAGGGAGQLDADIDGRRVAAAHQEQDRIAPRGAG